MVERYLEVERECLRLEAQQQLAEGLTRNELRQEIQEAGTVDAHQNSKLLKYVSIQQGENAQNYGRHRKTKQKRFSSGIQR